MDTGSTERPVRFIDLGLSKDLDQILTRLAFKTPTPIQEQAIPHALKGEDVIGIAQTGTGKTLAFALPMLQTLNKSEGVGLVLVPTRELANQVQEDIDRIGKRLGFKTILLVGGANMERQVRDLQRGPHIIVATPGRLNDHIERKTARLNHVSVLVLDEADRMLDMGFAPQIDRILQSVPQKRQTFLFSATMPEAIAKIGRKYMRDPMQVEAAPPGTTAQNIEQGVYIVDSTNRFRLLQDLLEAHRGRPVLVFCRTKFGTKKMAHILHKEGFPCEELHSNRSLAQRKKALGEFKRGRAHIMVATDVAARGIDVKEIALVVNYDLPDQLEDYVHRIGRTGRAGHTGCAVSFVAPTQMQELRTIERLAGEPIAVLEAPGTHSIQEVQALKERTAPRAAHAPHRRVRPSQGRHRRDHHKHSPRRSR
ncbi:MAG: DEAD/DEAH box helicase [Patescibacteria group bacterium]